MTFFIVKKVVTVLIIDNFMYFNKNKNAKFINKYLINFKMPGRLL